MLGILQFAVFGVLIPAVVAIVVAWILFKVLPGDLGQRYAAAVAVTVAFITGFGLATGGEHFMPTRHWHWLPYLGTGAMFVGPLVVAAGVRRSERWLVLTALAIIAAWLLVPHWPALQPARGVYVVVVSVYIALLAIGIGGLARRIPYVQLGGALSVTMAVTGLMILVGFYELLAQLGLAIAAAFAGVAVAAWRNFPAPVALKGAATVYAVLAGGVAFAGAVEPEPQLYEIMLAPLAPLALWLSYFGPFARFSERRQWVTRSVLVAVPLLIAAIWLAVRLIAGTTW